MKLFFALCLMLLTTLSAFAGEEAFTLMVEHYEHTSPRSLDNFRGRQWDLRNLLGSSRTPDTKIEWLSVENERPRNERGATYCVRVAAPAVGPGRAPAIAPEQRAESVKNLVKQLELRTEEMREAGAYFRIESPSRCGTTADSRIVRR